MSLNKVILIGRLGRDPEVRYMPNGEAVCNFSVATSETWNDRNGQRVERTEWHNITMYRKLAEIAGQYLRKGSQVYSGGAPYDDGYNQGGHSSQSSYQQAPQQQYQSAPAQEPPAAPARRPAPAQPTAPVEDIDDDIPF